MLCLYIMINKMEKQFVERERYLKKIKPFINKDVIKVLIGQRRVGKSYLLYQIIDEIKKSRNNVNIIYINKELEDYKDIVDWNDLLLYIKERVVDDINYVFIDEVQEIVDFERALRDLQARGGYDIYCTGSNAKMLSGELATFLSGRYIEIKVYSLSYIEFLSFHGLQNGKEAFNLFIKYGGLPYLKNLELKDSIIFEYIKGIYHTILYKDIIDRHQIRNTSLLENLIKFIASNTGSIVSATSISKYLKAQQINVTPKIIISYLTYLRDAFFIFRVQRTEIEGKKIFESGEKYYFEDLGLRHTVLKYQGKDIHKILENIIYQHLIITGFEVYVGYDKGKEIDFIAEKHDKKIYIQVAYLLHQESTKEREASNLLNIKDNHLKLIVTLDEYNTGQIKGVKVIHAIDFLSKDW